MEDFLNLLLQYGPYVGLAILVAGIVQALKAAFKNFFLKNTLGLRLMPFIPMVLGIVGGLFLPQSTMSAKIFMGGALGTMSSMIYNVLTRTFASGAVLQQKIDLKHGVAVSDAQAVVDADAVDQAATGPDAEVK